VIVFTAAASVTYAVETWNFSRRPLSTVPYAARELRAREILRDIARFA
jgi:hypothetical protein